MIRGRHISEFGRDPNSDAAKLLHHVAYGEETEAEAMLKTNPELLNYYVDIAALEYYKNNLESYNKDFAFQMKEFKEGNLLFEVMLMII